MRKETKTKIYVMADNANKILLITKDVADKLKTDLSSPEVTTYFAFKNMLPDYKDIIVPTLGTIIAEN
ncbi:MAG: hypothetical protein SPF92_04730 [Clostridia bacterium]|nr:hypothetical protein [Clostridia bacterium]